MKISSIDQLTNRLDGMRALFLWLWWVCTLATGHANATDPATSTAFPLMGDVVVVGAGVSGMAVAKAFRQRGCRSLTVFDKARSVGGHWAWIPNYVGVGVQNKREAYRYSDLPMQSLDSHSHSHSHSPRASAADCVAYLKAYAAKHGLFDSIRLGQEVVEVIARPGQRQSVVVRDVATGEEVTREADIVILAGGITPHLPPAAAADPASAVDVNVDVPRPVVCHSRQLDASLVRTAVDRKWRVVVVGGGKSACECVAALREASHPVSLLRCVASSSAASTCAAFEPQLWPRGVQRIVLALFHLSCRLAANEATRTLARVLRWPLFGIGAIADAPIGGGCWHTLNGQVVTRRMRQLVKGVKTTEGRMVGIGPSLVRCSGGETLPADLVVCATGFRIASPPIFIEEEGRKKRRCDVETEQPLLYRSMVLPQTPQISAILYNSMGINAMFSAELMATWLADFYACRYATGTGTGTAPGLDLDLPALVEKDAEPLRALGRGEPFNCWHFWRSGETAGGRGYASDYYEDQIYADLHMEMPSRRLALLRLQHDNEYYRKAAQSFEALANQKR